LLYGIWDLPGPVIKVKSESEVAQSCPTLSDPMDCSLPDSSAHGIFQARVLEWGAIAFSNPKTYQRAKTRFNTRMGVRVVSECARSNIGN